MNVHPLPIRDEVDHHERVDCDDVEAARGGGEIPASTWLSVTRAHLRHEIGRALADSATPDERADAVRLVGVWTEAACAFEAEIALAPRWVR